MKTGGELPTITKADSDPTPKPKSKDEEGTDKFSCLPIEAIHKIMLLLPVSETKGARVLSKYFYSNYRSLPVLDIDFDSFPPGRKNWAEEFHEFVMNSIRSYVLGPAVFLERLSLKATSFPKQFGIHDEEYGYITSAVSLMSGFALTHATRELIIDLPIDSLPSLPESVLQCRSLRTLKLSGLSLELVEMDYRLVFDCPSLEVLTVAHCYCWKDKTVITVASPNLKAAEFLFCKGLVKVEIEGSAAASLESFSLKKKNPDFEAMEKSCEIVNLRSCRSLKRLELESLDATDQEWLTNRVNVSVFPELEVLKLQDCHALKEVVALTLNERLKTMVLQGCDALERVIVAGATNLESFQLSKTYCPSGTLTPGGQRRPCVIDIGRGKKLKDLVLRSPQYMDLTNKWVRSNIARSYGFGLLESLALEACDLVTEMIFQSKNLKRLEVQNCYELRKMEVEAPNLVSFVYEGHMIENPVVIGSGNLDVKITINFPGYHYEYELFRDFISYFGHCKTLTLVCISQLLPIPLQVRDSLVSPLHDLQHLNIRLENEVSDPMELIETLLWLAPHPNTISITFDSKLFAILKFYFDDEDEDEDEDELVCCQFLAVKCWRHHLIRVGVEVCEGFKQELDLKSFFMKNAKAKLELTNPITPQSDENRY